MTEQSPPAPSDVSEDEAGWQRLAEEAATWPQDHAGLQALRKNHVNRLLRDKGYGHLVADQMEFSQAHYEEAGGIHYGKHPDSGMQAYVRHTEEIVRDRARRFHEVVDTGPNMNEQYVDELALVHDYFTRAGLKVAPITILSEEQYKGVTSQPTDSDMEGGIYTYGRVVAHEGSEQKRQRYGTDLLLGTLLHEAAHSTASSSDQPMITSGYGPGDSGQTEGFMQYTLSNGFVKPRRQGTEVKRDGQWLEEGGADLTRVRGMTELGREPRIGNKIVSFKDSIVYVGESNNKLTVIDGMPTVPARFAAAATPSYLLGSTPGVAAYGLDLLDHEVPGIYDAWVASRTDPTKQREVIQKIDSVRPGLYRELRLLPYTPDGFIAGLGIVRDALAQRQASVEQIADRPADVDQAH